MFPNGDVCMQSHYHFFHAKYFPEKAVPLLKDKNVDHAHIATATETSTECYSSSTRVTTRKTR